MTQPIHRPREKNTCPIALIQMSLLLRTDQVEGDEESIPTAMFSSAIPRYTMIPLVAPSWNEPEGVNRHYYIR